MGLDAFVRCNCYEEGKTKPLPFNKDWLFLNEDGIFEILFPEGVPQEEQWALEDELTLWLETCCEHEELYRCYTRVGNIHGIDKFCRALEQSERGSNKYEILLNNIPAGNYGMIDISVNAQIAAKLDEFCKQLSEETGIFLIDVKTGDTHSSCVESTFVERYRKEGIYIELDKDGVSVVEVDDINKVSKLLFRSMHFTHEILPEEKKVLLTDVATKQQIVTIFPSFKHPFNETPSCNGMKELKVIRRPFKPEEFLAIGALRKLLQASEETGNPIYWS